MLRREKVIGAPDHWGQFVPGPALLSRDDAGQLSFEIKESIKGLIRYTTLSKSLSFRNILGNCAFDEHCPSVVKKLSEEGGYQYRCGTVCCTKLFTTLNLAKAHLKSANHKVMKKLKSVEQPVMINENTAGPMMGDQTLAPVIPSIADFNFEA